MRFLNLIGVMWLLLAAAVRAEPAGADPVQKFWRSTSARRAAAEMAPSLVAARTRAIPRSVMEGADQPQRVVRLEAFDLTEVIEEDRQASREKGGRRIGVLRKTAAAWSLSGEPATAWRVLSDQSRVYLLELQSPAAEGIRLHVERIQLPPGAQLMVYSARDPDESQGPFTAADWASRESLWTPTIFDSAVRLEVVVPPGVHAAPGLVIAEIAHVYVKFDELAGAKEGRCHNDVTCYAEWDQRASGVAGLGAIGSAGFVFCTGCLLADGDPASQVNYFMTANHCVENQREADTLEFYWFFQTSLCNGAAPDPVSVPRTSGGADILAARSVTVGSDFCFLRLRNPPPAGTSFAGWSTETPCTCVTIACIHHPDGAHKRISFGRRADQDADFWYVRWFSGVTEPGSSGAPLFNENQEFIGQLFGGQSYCAYPEGLDEFGRFDRSINSLQPWLNPRPQPMLFFEDPRDFDGDGRTDLAVHHAPSATWYLYNSTTEFKAQQFGFVPTTQVVGDFDGDGASDLGVYHAQAGMWYTYGSTDGLKLAQFGYAGTWPVPADYDGDGATDLGVFDPANANWYLYGTTSGFKQTQFGFPGVTPVPCDYDGDQKSDIAVYYPPTGAWYIFRSSLGFVTEQFGYDGTIPVPQDYDDDGRRDLAVYDPGQPRWYMERTTAGFTTLVHGATGGYPVPGDYDGDGRADPANYSPGSGGWFIRQSALGGRTNLFGWSEAFPPGLRP